MAARNTGTPFTDSDGNNVTQTHLSTHIIIKCNNNVIGAMQEISIDESRSLKPIEEIGTDGIIDLTPNGSVKLSGSCKRVRFSKSRITAAFGLGWIHLKSQRVGFNIEIIDTFTDASNPIVTTIEGVWIKSIQTAYSAGDWVITDTFSWDAKDIYSIQNNTNVVGPVGPQGQTIYLNAYERQADRGEYRGAIDAPGLLTAFITDPSP